MLIKTFLNAYVFYDIKLENSHEYWYRVEGHIDFLDCICVMYSLTLQIQYYEILMYWYACNMTIYCDYFDTKHGYIIYCKYKAN